MKYRILAMSLASVITGAGCYNPQIGRCIIHCVGMEACPNDQTCGADGFCHAQGDGTCSTMGDGGNQVLITVVPIGLGTGTITADVDSSFQCTTADAGTSNCQLQVDGGTTVTFTENADSQSVFEGWSDAGATCAGANCSVTANAAINVGADFEATAAVVIDFGGPGDGTVTSQPSGLANTNPVEPQCEDIQNNSIGPCVGRFVINTQVILTANENQGNGTVNWAETVNNMPPPCLEGLNSTTCTFTISGDIEFGISFN